MAAAEDYLKSSNSITADSSKSNIQIIGEMKKRVKTGTLKVGISEGSMFNYISTAANNDSTSGIVSGGPRKGYWYDPNEKNSSEEKPTDKEKLGTGNKEVTIYEKDLYPLVQLWLEQKGIQVERSFHFEEWRRLGKSRYNWCRQGGFVWGC